MTTKDTLEQRRDEIVARVLELRPLVEQRSALDEITPEDDAALVKDTDELRTLATELDKVNTDLADIEERAALVEKMRSIQPVVSKHPVKAEMRSARDVWFMNSRETREAALPLLEDRGSFGHLSAHQMDVVDREVRTGQLVAKRALVTETDEYHDAWMQYITRPELLRDEQRAVLQEEVELRAYAEGATTTGGYGVPTAIDPQIILTDQETSNPFLTLASSMNVNTNVWKGVTSAGMTWSFDAEAAEVSDDQTTLGQPSITIFMARGFLPYSIEFEQDYAGATSELMNLLSVGYDELLVDQFTNGDGTTEPRGILTALDANTNVEVVTITDGAYQVGDVRAVYAALPQKYRRNAAWMMNIEVNLLTQAFGTEALGTQTVPLSTGVVSTLLNKPVYENAYFPDYTTTTGAQNIAVVGDFSNYRIARRAGMVVEQIPHLFGTTNNRPTGQRGLFGWARIGANTLTDVAFRLLQNQ